MKINTRVNLVSGESKMKGVADIVLDDVIVIKGIRIMEGQKGAFVSMPSQKVGSEYRETAFPITAEFREQLFGSILSAYEQKLQEELENEEKEKQDSEKSGKGKSKKQAHNNNVADEKIPTSSPEDNQEIDEGMGGMSGM